MFFGIPVSISDLASFINLIISSAVIIVAFSLLAFTLTYNFRNAAARRFALLLACVVVAYTGDVALNRLEWASGDSADKWLRLQWLGIAMLPFAYYIFSTAVLRTTNYRVSYGRWLGWIMLALSLLSAASAIWGDQLVGAIHFRPPLSYLEAGPYFWLFAAYFGLAMLLSLYHIWLARTRCLTSSSRGRMTYLLWGFVAPGIGIFPYLIALGRLDGGGQANAIIFVLAMVGNMMVAIFLVIMSYVVAYFGVLTPDRVVRYRLIRFFTRGPVVAILVIVAMQTIPRVERILGLPRDMILFSTITAVIVFSQLILSVTKSLVDRMVYREDRNEVSWMRELDRRLLTTSDLRQFLENNLTALCELLATPAGFVAGIVGPNLLVEATVGAPHLRQRLNNISEWQDVVNRAAERTRNGQAVLQPIAHAGYWIWPLVEPTVTNGKPTVVGILGVWPAENSLIEPLNGHASSNGAGVNGAGANGRSSNGAGGKSAESNGAEPNSAGPLPHLTEEDARALAHMIERTGRALVDRRVQQEVFVSLRRIIPDIERIQQMRGTVPYMSRGNQAVAHTMLLDPSPIHDPEFANWVKDALSHYWGGPKLTHSPLTKLRIVMQGLDQAEGDVTKALRQVLEMAIERLRPEGKQEFVTQEWLLYNILDMRFLQGRKVREIAHKLAVSESDLYRKQRIAIEQVARVLTEMELEDGSL